MKGSAVLVGLLWIGTSALFSTYANSLFLRTFNDAFAHTFVRFALSSGLGLAYAAVTARQLLVELPRLARKMLLPSMLLLTANLLNSMGMLRAGVTVTYVVKSLIPFFTVIICRIQGQRFGSLVYLTLAPVCVGVSLASATDLDFDWCGFACAMGSTLSQTLLNVTSRERIQDLQLSGSEAFLVMATLCTALSAPLLLLSLAQPDGLLRTCAAGQCGGSRADAMVDFRPSVVVLMAAVSYHFEYTLNFLFLPLCSSLAFSVTDIMRRLGTITFGAVLFAKPLSGLNAAGIMTSLLGVVSYSLLTKLGGAKVALPAEPKNGSAEDLASVASEEAPPCRTPDRLPSAIKAIREEGRGGSGDWTSHYSSALPPGKKKQVRVSTPPSGKRSGEASGSLSPSLSPGSGTPGSPCKERRWSHHVPKLWETADDSSLGMAPEVLCSVSVFSHLDLDSMAWRRAATSHPPTPIVHRGRVGVLNRHFTQ